MNRIIKFAHANLGKSQKTHTFVTSNRFTLKLQTMFFFSLTRVGVGIIVSPFVIILGVLIGIPLGLLFVVIKYGIPLLFFLLLFLIRYSWRLLRFLLPFAWQALCKLYRWLSTQIAKRNIGIQPQSSFKLPV